MKRLNIASRIVALVMVAAMTLSVGHVSAAEFYPAYEQEIVASSGFTPICAHGLVERMGPGWNLGNTFDATHIGHGSSCSRCIPNSSSPPGGGAGTGIWNCGWSNHPNGRYTGASVAQLETAWLSGTAAATTQQLIQNVSAAGFETIRIPITWYKATAGPPNWNIRDNWMARVRQVVDWAYAEGMIVIINTHHEELIFANWLSTARRADSINFVTRIWTQIATEFAGYSERLVFEGLNEPRVRHATGEWTGGTTEHRETVNQMNQAFVNAVRATGGNNTYRVLMVPTFAASASTAALNGFTRPNDPAGNTPNRLAMSVHAYIPNNFAGVGSGPLAQTWTESSVTTMLNQVQSRANALGMPVVMGEWGAVSRSSSTNEATRANYARFYAQEAARRGFAHIWWDNGGTDPARHDQIEGNFGLFNRRNQWPSTPRHALVFPNITAAITQGHTTGVGLRGQSSCNCPTDTPTRGRNYRNLNMTPGINETVMGFTWHSGSPTGSIRIWEQGNPATARTISSTVGRTFTVQRPTAEGGTGTYFVHHATITNLAPDTPHQYVVVWDNGESPPKTFRTGGASNFQFVAVSDPQMGTGPLAMDGDDWANALSVAAAAFPGAQFVLSTGDQVATANVASGGNPQTPTASQLTTAQRRFDHLLSPPQLQSLPFAPTVGNHDGSGALNMNPFLFHSHYNLPFTASNVRRFGNQFPTQQDYWFRYGDVLFINLDSNTRTWACQMGGGSNGRRDWFNNVIAQNADALWRVVSFHHSPYSAVRASSESAKTEVIQNWIPVFQTAGIDIVLSGHDHAYSRSHHMWGNSPRLNQRWVDEDSQVHQGNFGTQHYAVLDPDGITFIALGTPTRSNVRQAANMPRSYILRHSNAYFGSDAANLRNISTVTVTPDTFSVATYSINNAEVGQLNTYTMVDLYTIIRSDAGGGVPAGTYIPQFTGTNTIPDRYTNIPFNWNINMSPPDINVAHGATNHVRVLSGIDITPCIIESGAGATLTINYTAAGNNSNRRILAWTNLSGVANVSSIDFLTTANLSAGNVVITNPRIEQGESVATIAIPRQLLASGANTATTLYVAIATDQGIVGDTANGPNRYTIAANHRGHDEFVRFDSVVLTARAVTGAGNPAACVLCSNLPCRCPEDLPTFSATIIGGGTGASASPNPAPQGQRITLNAGVAPAGQRFVNWTSGNVTITNPTQQNGATFTMPGQAVTVTANWEPVVQATPDVTWPVGLTAFVGQTIGLVPLPGNVGTPGVFSWTAPATLVGAVGARTHNLTFTPADIEAFYPVTSNVSVMVNEATQTPLTWVVNPADPTVRQINSPGQGSQPGGDYVLVLDITPADQARLRNSTGDATLRVTFNTTWNTARRVLAWTNLSANAGTTMTSQGNAPSGAPAGSFNPAPVVREHVTFATTANIAGNQVRVSPDIPNGHAANDPVNINIPRNLLVSGQNVASRIYIILAVNAGTQGSDAAQGSDRYTRVFNNRLASPRDMGGVDAAQEREFFNSIVLEIPFTEPTLWPITIIDGGTGASANPNPAMQNQTITLNAGDAPAGFEFSHWSSTTPGVNIQNANSADDASFTMINGAVSVQANWTPLNFQVTVAGTASAQTAITPAGAQPAGTTMTVTVTAPAGQRFVAAAGAAIFVTGAANFNLTVAPDRLTAMGTFTMPVGGGIITVNAGFETIVVNYTVNVVGSASAQTAIAPEGSHPVGTTMTVTVTAPTGQRFTAAGGASVPVTGAASFNFTVAPDRLTATGTFTMPAGGGTLTVNAGFETIIGNYTVTVVGSASAQTAITPAGAHPAGTTMTMTVTAPAGQRFTAAGSASIPVTGAASFNLTVAPDRLTATGTFTMPAGGGALTVNAGFETIVGSFTVTFDPNGGERVGGGELVQIVASGGAAVPPVVELDGYNFTGWDGSYANVTASVTLTAGWEQIICNAIVFDCANFEAYVRQRLNRPTGNIYPNCVLGITHINVPGRDITSFKGLEYFTNITSLFAQNNPGLTTLEIHDMSYLRNIVIQSGNLQSLTISNLPVLVHLNASNHNLQSLVLENTPMLMGLSISRNHNLGGNITGLQQLANLQVLWAEDNNMDALDVSGLSSLETLRVAFNNLASLSVPGTLIALDVRGNLLPAPEAIAGLPAGLVADVYSAANVSLWQRSRIDSGFAFSAQQG